VERFIQASLHDPPPPPYALCVDWSWFFSELPGFFMESDRGGAVFGLLSLWGGCFRFRCVSPLYVFSLWWLVLGWGVEFGVFLGGRVVYGCWSPVVWRRGMEGFGPSDASSNLARAIMHNTLGVRLRKRGDKKNPNPFFINPITLRNCYLLFNYIDYLL